MLKCWDSICSPKSNGGLGFRRLHDSNKALISKLAWCIASNKELLWVQLIKSKYLRGKSFLLDDLSFHDSSWIWTDIKNSRDLIVRGAVFHVSLNSDVLIWKDSWIPSLSNFTPHIDLVNPNNLNFNLVRSLIHSSSCTWNISVLNAIFPSDVANEIKKI